MAHGAKTEQLLPKKPVDAVIGPLKKFVHIESASGIVLLFTAITAPVLANSRLADGFLAFWQKKVGLTFGSFQVYHSLQHWINDGLMAIQGERDLLKIPYSFLVRLRYNPFYAFLEMRTLEWIENTAKK